MGIDRRWRDIGVVRRAYEDFEIEEEPLRQGLTDVACGNLGDLTFIIIWAGRNWPQEGLDIAKGLETRVLFREVWNPPSRLQEWVTDGIGQRDEKGFQHFWQKVA